MNAYRAYIETEQYGRIAVPLCGDCLPDDATIAIDLYDGLSFANLQDIRQTPENINWSEGALAMMGFLVFWLSLLFIGVVLL